MSNSATTLILSFFFSWVTVADSGEYQTYSLRIQKTVPDRGLILTPVESLCSVFETRSWVLNVCSKKEMVVILDIWIVVSKDSTPTLSTLNSMVSFSDFFRVSPPEIVFFYGFFRLFSHRLDSSFCPQIFTQSHRCFVWRGYWRSLYTLFGGYRGVLFWDVPLWLGRLETWFWDLLAGGCMPVHKHCKLFLPTAGRP